VTLPVLAPGAAVSAAPADELLSLLREVERLAEIETQEGSFESRLRTAVQALYERTVSAETQLSAHEREQQLLEATIRALRAATRVTENVASAFQRERVLAAIPDALTRSFGAAVARVWLVGPGDRCDGCAFADRCSNRSRCLHLVEQGGFGPLDLALARVPIGEFSVGRVAALSGLVATNDLASDPGLADPDWAHIEGLCSFAGHPMVHEGALLGVVAMWSRAPIRSEVLEALRILARHAATAIAGAQLISDVREQSAKNQVATGRLEALLEASRSGVILFDRAGRATYVNGGFRRLFAADRQGGPAQFVGLQHGRIEAALQAWLPSGTNAAVLSEPHDAEAPPSVGAGDREILIQLPGESRPRVLRRYSAPVHSAKGEPLGWMDVFDDVTHAHEVDRMKTEFISTVSHELRTPLTSIKGSLALLLDGSVPLDEEITELLQVSKRNADRLVRLVNDILDISKIEAGKLELDLAALRPERLCGDSVAGIDGIAKKVGVRVRCELQPDLPAVLADQDRVVQVLTNLLSNALKFSPAGEEVVLRARRHDSAVCFEVKDNGPGIPPEFRSKLFTQFAQSDRARREQEGTGLGLAICRALVLKHEGEIWVESEPGHGASFFFTLPTVGDAPAPPPYTPTSTPPGNSAS
jgi:signal transduction histidine kinase